ncbi:MAG: 4Fe-4S dicluster domain-containing protein [Nitrospina sp.]|nr:4Fe-4S dicluster domain-containing protein [Nitrospina sp.]
MNKPGVIDREGLNRLIQTLIGRGYQVVGPTVRDEAIVYDNVFSIEDLPAGWTDEQEGGTYRLKKRSDDALFGYTLGPHSWKRFLHPPERRLWQAQKDSLDFDIVPEQPNNTKYAFLGMRSCELHAIAIQDKVFIESPHTDLHYQSLRQNALFVAVNCGQAGNTCFCVSMQTGPKVEAGYDLVLTEILDDSHHSFLIEAGSEAGKNILEEVKAGPAGAGEIKKAEEIVTNTAKQMGRAMETGNIKELLYENLEHPAWGEIAERCLSCANCTMVCPTCFCSTVEDVTDVAGDHAERWQKWDSCFTMDFSSIHGGAVRNSTQSRYRQWMTHKLASWQDQFDTSGCVGCGRCITWCPVGIDLTREVAVIRESTTCQEENFSGSEAQNENS